MPLCLFSAGGGDPVARGYLAECLSGGQVIGGLTRERVRFPVYCPPFSFGIMQEGSHG